MADALYLDQVRQLGHEESHLLGSSDDVVVLAGPLPHLLVEVVSRHLRERRVYVILRSVLTHHDGSLARGGRMLEDVVGLVVRVRRRRRPGGDIAAVLTTGGRRRSGRNVSF